MAPTAGPERNGDGDGDEGSGSSVDSDVRRDVSHAGQSRKESLRPLLPGTMIPLRCEKVEADG